MQINNHQKSACTFSFHGTPIGDIFWAEGHWEISGDDKNLTGLFDRAAADGIPGVEYHHAPHQHISVFKKFSPEDDRFLSEFIHLAKNNGYECYEEVVKVDKELEQLLHCLPDQHSLKKDILDNLSNMTYLEKTSLIKKLEDKFDELAAEAVL